ncbi:hypothetical protein DM02DRAFT_623901 [Periconia macrospinosa]|uniref:Uncharacterized protein n=1 Tax=Periconia macrospinosa TaxID=97972 RepID=A0A2V1E762_9PLEO|nr:hypothetical protein DM02DRAFT_623901 [Periconia macrospinosa]
MRGWWEQRHRRGLRGDKEEVDRGDLEEKGTARWRMCGGEGLNEDAKVCKVSASAGPSYMRQGEAMGHRHWPVEHLPEPDTIEDTPYSLAIAQTKLSVLLLTELSNRLARDDGLRFIVWSGLEETYTTATGNYIKDTLVEALRFAAALGAAADVARLRPLHGTKCGYATQ